MAQPKFVFKEIVAKTKVRKRVRADVCSKTGVVKSFSAESNLLDSAFLDSQYSERFPRGKKTQEEKYREHHLARLNKYLRAAKRGKVQGVCRGIKYHVTLTLSDEYTKLASNPAALTKKIRSVMKKNEILGLGVLEIGKGDSGKLHAHVLSDKKISRRWWKYGHVKNKRASKSDATKRYVKKSFYLSEEKAAYYAPRQQAVVEMTDREFFSGMWGRKGSGSKECKLFVSDSLKALEKTLMATDEMSEHSKDSNVDVSIVAVERASDSVVYSKSFAIRADLFMSCFKQIICTLENNVMNGSNEDNILHIANLSWDEFCKRIETANHGTCGYRMVINLGGKKPVLETISLYEFLKIESVSRWLLDEHREQMKSTFKNFSRCINNVLVDDGR